MAQKTEESNTKTRIRRTRRSKRPAPEPMLQIEPGNMPPAYGQYHMRPAKSAMEALNLQYEPPYESPALQVGQRAEHPEYDTGHAVERPMELEEDAA